jgi:hypothetical protein
LDWIGKSLRALDGFLRDMRANKLFGIQKNRTGILLVGVDSFPQFPGTLEGDNLSRRQHHICTGGRISAFAFLLVIDAKLSKSTHKNIFTGLKGFLDNLKKGFHDPNGFILGDTQFRMNSLNDLSFCKCHSPVLLFAWLSILFYKSHDILELSSILND